MTELNIDEITLVVNAFNKLGLIHPLDAYEQRLLDRLVRVIATLENLDLQAIKFMNDNKELMQDLKDLEDEVDK